MLIHAAHATQASSVRNLLKRRIIFGCADGPPSQASHPLANLLSCLDSRVPSPWRQRTSSPRVSFQHRKTLSNHSLIVSVAFLQ